MSATTNKRPLLQVWMYYWSLWMQEEGKLLRSWKYGDGNRVGIFFICAYDDVTLFYRANIEVSNDDCAEDSEEEMWYIVQPC